MKQLLDYPDQAMSSIEKLLPLLDQYQSQSVQGDLAYTTSLYRQIRKLLDLTVSYPYPSLIHLLKYLYNELETASMQTEISPEKLEGMQKAMQNLSGGLHQLCDSGHCELFPEPPSPLASQAQTLNPKKLFEALSPHHPDAQGLRAFAEEYLHILTKMESLVRQLRPDPSSKGPLNSMLRILHGMKGTSCFFIDLAPNISRLCHEFETVLTLALEGGSQNLSSSKIDCIGKILHVLELLLVELKERVESHEIRSQPLDLRPVFLGLKKMAEGEFVEPESILNYKLAPPGMDSSIRVSAGRLDHLTYDVHGVRLALEELKRDLNASPGILKEITRIERSVLSIQNQVLDFRLFPIGLVFQRFTLQVRELCHRLDKQVNLSFKGTETRIDKGVCEILIAALTHLISNAVAHGIEKPAERELAGKPREGALLLSASCRGNHVVLETSDDGRGINPDNIRQRAKQAGILRSDLSPDEELMTYLTHPGFSTQSELSQTMGRGLGLATVHQEIESLGGRLEIENSILRGTTFRLIIPLSFYTCESLVLQAGHHTYTLLMDQVHAILESQPDHLKASAIHKNLMWKGRKLEVLRLRSPFYQHETEENYSQTLIVEDTKERIFALTVEKCLAREHLLVRPMSHPCLQGIPFSSSASLLPDGNLSCVLDLESYYNLEKKLSPLSDAQIRNPPTSRFCNPAPGFQGRGLVFRVGYTQAAIPILSLKEVLEFFQPTPIPSPSETVLGIVHLRGEIIPVLNLPQILGEQNEEPGPETCILITSSMGFLSGLLVHGLRGILAMETIKTNSSQDSGGAISGRFKAGGVQGITLDPGQILRDSLKKIHDSLQERGKNAN